MRQSNKNLKEETADTFGIGAAYSPIDDLNLSLDYYYIKIDDVIQLATTQTQFYQELNTGSNPNVIRDANGDVEQVYAGMVNWASSRPVVWTSRLTTSTTSTS